jgi:hypothetical protein
LIIAGEASRGWRKTAGRFGYGPGLGATRKIGELLSRGERCTTWGADELRSPDV